MTIPLCITGATVKLPIEAKKYMRNIVEQSVVEFFVAVKVRETKQLFLKVCFGYQYYSQCSNKVLTGSNTLISVVL